MSVEWVGPRLGEALCRLQTGTCYGKDSSRNKFHPVRRTVHEMTLVRNLIWTVRRTKTGSYSLTSPKCVENALGPNIHPFSTGFP